MERAATDCYLIDGHAGHDSDLRRRFFLPTVSLALREQLLLAADRIIVDANDV